MTQSLEKPQSNAVVDVQKAAQDCLDCYTTCLKTIGHCLQMGGEHAGEPHIKLMMDCAEICQLMASFLVRGSTSYSRINVICAEICEQCATNCEQMMGEDTQMRACAEACRRCADMAQKTAYSGSALGTSL